MNKIHAWFQSETFKQKVYPEFTRTMWVIVSTIIYGIGVAWFLEASQVPLYTGGVPGLGQLVRDAFYVWFGRDLGPNFLGLFVIILNITDFSAWLVRCFTPFYHPFTHFCFTSSLHFILDSNVRYGIIRQK
jgi:hypothetical protein